MVSTSSTAQPGGSDWNNLTSDRGNLSDFEMACIICGGAHLSRDHWEFLQTMPQEPEEMVGDLVRMGLYKDQQMYAGDKVNAYEIRKA